MIASKKSLVDNWSLEQAAGLLNNDINRFLSFGYDLFPLFGGLSNFINGMLLYEETTFLKNGNQSAWQRFSGFHNKISPFLTPAEAIENSNSFNSFFFSEDCGAKYYLMMSKYLDAELFISTDRANKVLQQELPKLDNDFFKVMNVIDTDIEDKLEKNWVDKVKLGIKNNFLLPSLTQYVLRQTSSQDDFIEVLVQLKRSNEIFNLKQKITETCSDFTNYTKFQNEVDRLIKKQFNIKDKYSTTLSVNINVLFLSITKTFDLDLEFNFMRHKSYLTYLKDIIACRTEMFGLKKHLERIFKVDIEKLTENIVAQNLNNS